jgi:hypothetical protein
MPDSVRALLLAAGAAVAFYAGALIIQCEGPVLVAVIVAVGGTMGLMFVLFRPGRSGGGAEGERAVRAVRVQLAE